MALSTNGLGYIQESKSLGYIESGSSSVPGFAKVHCSTATKNFVVDGANDLMFGPPLFPTLTVTDYADTKAADDATAANTLVTAMIGGIITSTTAAAVSITLPTAAQVVAALGANVRVGTCLRCKVVNLGGANAITLLTNTGLTVDTDNDTVAAGEGQEVIIRVTNATSGSEAATVYVA